MSHERTPGDLIASSEVLADRRVLVLLDLFTGIDESEWLAAVPGPVASEHRVRLTDFGATRRLRPDPDENAAAWQELGEAVERVAAKALELASEGGGQTEIYVAGQAYLCLFTHLGYRLSRFKHRQVVLGRRQGDQAIEAFDLRRSRGDAAVLVEPAGSAVESQAPGVVAVCVDTGGRTRRSLEDAVEVALRQNELNPAAFVEVRSQGDAPLTAENITRAAFDLEQLFSRLPSRHRRAETIGLFLAGPTVLAYLAGSSINPTVCSQEVQLTNFYRNAYALTYRLPFLPPGPDGARPFGEGQVRVLFLAVNPGLSGDRDGLPGAEPRGETRPGSARDFVSLDIEGKAGPAAGAPLSIGAAPGRRALGALDLEREARDIQQALRSTPVGEKRFKLETAWAVRVSELQGLLEEHRPHVVHFSGHGLRTEGLVLLDDHDRAAPVPPDKLRELFQLLRRGQHQNDLRLVVLNACWSAPQAEALAAIVGCAVGMPQPIEDETAIRFASKFYGHLASGKTIRLAFETSKVELGLLRLPGADEPQLF